MRSRAIHDLVKVFTTRSGPSWGGTGRASWSLGQLVLPGYVLALIVLAAQAGLAKPVEERSLAPIEEPALFDEMTAPAAGKALQDTIWIADWNFDGPGGTCTEDGWVKYDNRILNDGSNYWAITTAYAGTIGSGSQAVLGKHDLCWAGDGYGNDWDYSIVLKYSGWTGRLSFAYISDSEPGFDFVTVEGDSLGLSEALGD